MEIWDSGDIGDDNGVNSVKMVLFVSDDEEGLMYNDVDIVLFYD